MCFATLHQRYWIFLPLNLTFHIPWHYQCRSFRPQNIQVCMCSCTIPWYWCTPHQHCSCVFLWHTRQYLSMHIIYLLVKMSVAFLQHSIDTIEYSNRSRPTFSPVRHYFITCAGPFVSWISRFTFTVVRSLGVDTDSVSAAFTCSLCTLVNIWISIDFIHNEIYLVKYYRSCLWLDERYISQSCAPSLWDVSVCKKILSMYKTKTLYHGKCSNGFHSLVAMHQKTH